MPKYGSDVWRQKVILENCSKIRQRKESNSDRGEYFGIEEENAQEQCEINF